MKRIIVSLAALVVGSACLVGHAAIGAGAAVAEFTIGLEITEGPPGSGPTTTHQVPADAQGRVCTFTITNNESSRPRPPDTITSDVTFSSDGRTLALVNVERSNGATTSGQLVVGATVTATITRGADPTQGGGGAYSGQDAAVVCPEPTTPTVSPTTPTVSPSTGVEVEGAVVTADETVTVAPQLTG